MADNDDSSNPPVAAGTPVAETYPDTKSAGPNDTQGPRYRREDRRRDGEGRGGTRRGRGGRQNDGRGSKRRNQDHGNSAYGYVLVRFPDLPIPALNHAP